MRSDRSSRLDRKRFLRWLNSEPANGAAYSEMESLWEDIGLVAGEPPIVDLRREALEKAPPNRFAYWRQAMAIAASIALLVLVALPMLYASPQQPTASRGAPQLAQADSGRLLRTAVGERSIVTLEDGSVIELNTNTLARVEYAGDIRRIRLIRGQAMFEVAHDGDRPFVVEASDRRVIALGTKFDVHVEQSRIKVTLLEGRVKVEPIDRSRREAKAGAKFLEPGELLVASVDRGAVVIPADIQREVGWRTGRIAFSDEPLSDVLNEINRYSTAKVVIADPSLAELRVSGVFRVGSVGNFVSAIDMAFPVTAERKDGQVALKWDPEEGAATDD